MEWKDRSGVIQGGDDSQDRFLAKLYGNALGRGIVRLLIRPSVSKAGGWLLDRKFTSAAVGPFVRAKDIDLSEYERQSFDSYNDFFTRRIRPECRPVDMDPEHLIAPCDSRLTVCQITKDAQFRIKNTVYTMESLVRSPKLAGKFRGGQILIFRLTVDDYHHYCYADNGTCSAAHKIRGVFHTVNPAAGEQYPVYKENTRYISFLKSENFGTVLMMEVGALMVGKVVNLTGAGSEVCRGQEKGYFEFGGSTVILCLKKDKVLIDRDILENSRDGFETRVKLGEKIGVKAGSGSRD
ncbi:MAG: phosphatidylserine decarboxylase [Emergencia sp.]